MKTLRGRKGFGLAFFTLDCCMDIWRRGDKEGRNRRGAV